MNGKWENASKLVQCLCRWIMNSQIQFPNTNHVNICLQPQSCKSLFFHLF